MNDIKICILGGDLRQIYAAQSMYDNGYEVRVFGIDTGIPDNIKSCSLKNALEDVSLILLPLPFSTDGIRLCCPLSNENIKLDDVISFLTKGQIITGGRLSEGFCQKIKEKNCNFYDYYNSERLSILNAIPTAEGAIAIAINETNITIFNSKCAIAGFGRIGRILAKMLKNLGAEVTIFARSESALTWAEAEGYCAVNICQMADHVADKNIIFNTVPSIVIDKKVLDQTNKNVLITDLSSAPGGVDLEYAKKHKRKVIFAQSLPGKVAPETAGKIIADCVLTELKGGLL